LVGFPARLAQQGRSRPGYFVFREGGLWRPLALLGAKLREFTIVPGDVEIGRAEQIVFGAGRELSSGRVSDRPPPPTPTP